MPRAPKYPKYTTPSEAFLQRLKKTLDPRVLVTELQFVQWSSKRFSATWRHGEVGKTFTAEMSLGGAEPTLEAIEQRVIKFVSYDPTV
jgi:hypothetical protein